MKATFLFLLFFISTLFSTPNIVTSYVYHRSKNLGFIMNQNIPLVPVTSVHAIKKFKDEMLVRDYAQEGYYVIEFESKYVIIREEPLALDEKNKNEICKRFENMYPTFKFLPMSSMSEVLITLSELSTPNSCPNVCP